MGAVENVKEIANLIGKFHDIELNRRILKLEEEILDLSRDKRRAEEKIEESEKTLRLKKELNFKEPFYWLEGDKTPFCSACWEGSSKRRLRDGIARHANTCTWLRKIVGMSRRNERDEITVVVDRRAGCAREMNRFPL
jgi:hypothetical protein